VFRRIRESRLRKVRDKWYLRKRSRGRQVRNFKLEQQKLRDARRSPRRDSISARELIKPLAGADARLLIISH